jgi:hypothetical protein
MIKKRKMLLGLMEEKLKQIETDFKKDPLATEEDWKKFEDFFLSYLDFLKKIEDYPIRDTGLTDALADCWMIMENIFVILITKPSVVRDLKLDLDVILVKLTEKAEKSPISNSLH